MGAQRGPLLSEIHRLVTAIQVSRGYSCHKFPSRIAKEQTEKNLIHSSSFLKSQGIYF